MKSNICFFCKRIISDHTKDEALDCALEICNKEVIVGIACSADDQLRNSHIHQNVRSFSD